MQAQEILNSLNIISEKLFKSVEEQVYEILDKIVIIGADILKKEPLSNIFYEQKPNGIIVIANALIVFFIINYISTQLICLYNGDKAENVYVFILKTVIIGIVVNNSYFICEQILTLNGALTDSIDVFTKNISNQNISFVALKQSILSMKDFMNSDLLSLDGLIKGVISFGAISILINFSIRYVTVIFLLIIAPLTILCKASLLTEEIFKTWCRVLITNLLIQIIVKLVILIPIMYKDTNSTMYKIILIGAIYLLYKINMFSKELLSKYSSVKNTENIYTRGR